MSARRNTREFARPRGAASPELSGRKVLIVDDDPLCIEKVRQGLSMFGYEFLEAADGTQALATIRAARPDLVVMDIEMPGLSGVEVCRIVKANATDAGFGFIPVILMTASGGAGKIEGLELGADDYLVKPFDMLELSARVKSMLRLKLLQDALLEKNRELDRANKELANRREELIVLTRTDGLTGLFNRRYFEERLQAEFNRSTRYRAPLACVMLDLDHFKRLNDSWGHAFGDQVLREVAKVTRATLRTVDLVARYGGEELIALLPETGPEKAFAAAERIRSAIALLPLSARRKDGSQDPVAVTASLGVATYPVPSPAQTIDSCEALVRAADDALYAAKDQGRNRVVQHHDA